MILSAEGYFPSVAIDLKSVGISGTIFMDAERGEEQLQFGVSIEYADLPFKKSLILTIVPRFMFINNLG